MPLLAPFAGLLVGLGLIVVAVVGYALLKSTQAWLRPLVREPTKSHGFLSFLPIPALTHKATTYLSKRAEHYVKVALSHFVAANTQSPARFFVSLAHLVNWTMEQQARFAEDVAVSLHLAKHHEIPRQITSRTAVIKRDAHAAHQRATHVDVRERAHAKRFEVGIDRLRADLHALQRDFGGIDALVRGGHLRARLRTVERELAHVIDVDMPRVKAWEREGKRTQVRHGSRLRRLEKLTAVGALTALVTHVLLRRFPFMRCGSFGRLARMLNCRHFGFLADLLAKTAFGIFFFENVCRVIELTAELAAPVMRKLVPILAEPAAALCNGRHREARPLPLTTTPLPKPAAPLPL